MPRSLPFFRLQRQRPGARPSLSARQAAVATLSVQTLASLVLYCAEGTEADAGLTSHSRAKHTGLPALLWPVLPLILFSSVRY
jgi:hypothetical protein